MRTPAVVVADDNVDLVTALKRRFEARGVRVETAGNAMHALNVIHASNPRLVVLDVHMPGGTGLAIAEMLAADRRFRETPVIMITGDNSEDIVRRCHTLCAYYVPKCPDLWSRIEPLASRFLPAQSDAVSDSAAGPEVAHHN